MMKAGYRAHLRFLNCRALLAALEADLLGEYAARHPINHSHHEGLLFLVETKVNSSSTSSGCGC